MKVRPSRVAWAIVGTLLVLFAISLLFPVVNGRRPGSGKRDEALQSTLGLITALRAYRMEYGSFPVLPSERESDPRKRNAELMKVLSGKESAQNPRKIAFFEARTARKKWRTFHSGLDPVDGTLLDPWGNPYRVRFSPPGDADAASPYNDESDPSQKREVLAWSLGPDGKQGREDDPAAFEGSDDIAFWR